MANTLRIKRRSSAGAAGAPTSLAAAELAYNEKDDTLYYGWGDSGSGVATVVKPIGGPGFVSGGGGSTFSFSATPPSSPAPGNFWFDSTTGFLSIFINDGNTQQWVQVSPTGGSGFTTGDAKLTYKATADPGWIFANDGSIGNASSNSTTRANADTVDLFTLFYNNITALPVQDNTGTTVSRGASAAADYAANRRLVIPKALGRSIAIAGSGSGLTSRALGTIAGAETETPTVAKTASHDHAQGFAVAGTYCPGFAGYGNFANTSLAGGGTALNVLDPSTYLNIMIKL